jgi:glucosamine--fructose-6-phosphate aminotransferase (isomerizing)
MEKNEAPKDDLFLTEILEQPQALRACLAQTLDLEPLHSRMREAWGGLPRLVVFTGMGSSLDVCYPASILLSERGLPAVAMETAELLHYFPSLRLDDCLLIVVTQSGESAEPVRLMQELPRGMVVVSVTNGLSNTVARRSTVALDIRAGNELTVSTKTYVASLFALVQLAYALMGIKREETEREFYDTVDALEEFLNGWRATIQPLIALAQSCEHLTLIGRGPSLATAHEGALILKEAGHRTCEAISGGHFRHGPIELVSERFGYILFPGAVFPGRRTRDLMLSLGRDISGYGGKVAYVGPAPTTGDDALWITLPGGNPYLAPALEIVPVQLLAWSLASLEDRTINAFEKMGKVTRTE